MISALRKIEGRGELPGATSAVMELCVDNPREGFADLFATHPSVDSRIQALVKFAGGHDPGPLALPSGPEAPASIPPGEPPPLPAGPWGGSQATPADIPPQGPWTDPAPRPSDSSSGPSSGPWGRR
jgi:heat shock protein HtpX